MVLSATIEAELKDLDEKLTTEDENLATEIAEFKAIVGDISNLTTAIKEGTLVESVNKLYKILSDALAAEEAARETGIAANADKISNLQTAVNALKNFRTVTESTITGIQKEQETQNKQIEVSSKDIEDLTEQLTTVTTENTVLKNEIAYIKDILGNMDIVQSVYVAGQQIVIGDETGWSECLSKPLTAGSYTTTVPASIKSAIRSDIIDKGITKYGYSIVNSPNDTNITEVLKTGSNIALKKVNYIQVVPAVDIKLKSITGTELLPATTYYSVLDASTIPYNQTTSDTRASDLQSKSFGTGIQLKLNSYSGISKDASDKTLVGSSLLPIDSNLNDIYDNTFAQLKDGVWPTGDDTTKTLTLHTNYELSIDTGNRVSYSKAGSVATCVFSNAYKYGYTLSGNFANVIPLEQQVLLTKSLDTAESITTREEKNNTVSLTSSSEPLSTQLAQLGLTEAAAATKSVLYENLTMAKITDTILKLDFYKDDVKDQLFELSSTAATPNIADDEYDIKVLNYGSTLASGETNSVSSPFKYDSTYVKYNVFCVNNKIGVTVSYDFTDYRKLDVLQFYLYYLATDFTWQKLEVTLKNAPGKDGSITFRPFEANSSNAITVSDSDNTITKNNSKSASYFNIYSTDGMTEITIGEKTYKIPSGDAIVQNVVPAYYLLIDGHKNGTEQVV